MFDGINLDMATDRSAVRHDGKTVGEIVTIVGRTVFVWNQELLRGYEGSNWFAMSQPVLAKVPTDVEEIYVRTPDDEGYFYKRQDLECGKRIDVTDPFFNTAPEAPQYAVRVADARETFDWDAPRMRRA